MIKQMRKKVARFIDVDEQPENNEEFEEQVGRYYLYETDDGETVLKVEEILKDVNNYYTEGGSIDAAVLDYGEDGGFFYLQEPNVSHALDIVKIDLIRAFTRASDHLMIDRDTALEELDEVTPESLKKYVDAVVKQTYGNMGLGDIVLGEYQRILEERGMPTNPEEAKPGEKPQPESQQTLN